LDGLYGHEVDEDEMGGACNTNGEKETYWLLVGKPEGKRPLGRPRCRWVVNITIDFGEISWYGVDCIGLALDRDKCSALVNAVTNVQVP
jgi:hypothetical protein